MLASKMNRRNLLLVSLAVIVALAVVALIRSQSDATRRRRYFAARSIHAPLSVDTLGTLDPDLRESSGLAVSRRWPGVLWTHNDSGDEPRFFAMDRHASVLGVWTVTNATAIDWESMDLGPCPTVEGDCLYLSDTGNNALNRDTMAVWVVPEPDPSDTVRTVEALGAVRFAYPDGPHDVEGLAVDPGGDLVLVTKGRSGPTLLYTIPVHEASVAMTTGRAITVGKAHVLPIEPDWVLNRIVTGAAIDPSARFLALRTYSELYVLPWPLPDSLPPDPPSCFLGDLEPQGEAVAWEREDRAFLLTSETADGERGRLLRVECAIARDLARR